jgi:hypothetical protein
MTEGKLLDRRRLQRRRLLLKPDDFDTLPTYTAQNARQSQQPQAKEHQEGARKGKVLQESIEKWGGLGKGLSPITRILLALALGQVGRRGWPSLNSSPPKRFIVRGCKGHYYGNIHV